MDVENLSDFEINWLVAEKLGILCVEESREENGVYIGTGCGDLEKFDPCNRPSEAWPIILENKIGIDFRASKNLDPIAKRFASNQHYVVDKNPLRAAMIVYVVDKDAPI